MEVLVPDAKMNWSLGVKLLVPGCGSTGPWMCPEMLPEKIGTYLRRMKAYG
jgi:hypothetical protein